jgi:hypothetical protein
VSGITPIRGRVTLSRFGPRPFALGFCLSLSCGLAPLPAVAREASTILTQAAAAHRGMPSGSGVGAAATQAFSKLNRCRPGPWGDLEYYYIYLEPPDRVVDDMVLPEPSTKWCFPGGTDASVRALLNRAGIPVELQEYLLDPEHCALQDGVLTVFPPLPDLLAMTPAQRAALYGELAKSALNKFCAQPVMIPDSDAVAAAAGTEGDGDADGVFARGLAVLQRSACGDVDGAVGKGGA